MTAADVAIRRARTSDIPIIRDLIELNAPDRRLLSKATVSLYEGVQEFAVATVAAVPVACGALHVMWHDLAEVRTLAVSPEHMGEGIGGLVLDDLIARGRRLGVRRIFCLTFEVEFFARFGFRRLTDDVVSPEVYDELLRSEDEGVAEFLELERVKPNTLGNQRMILRLDPEGS